MRASFAVSHNCSVIAFSGPLEPTTAVVQFVASVQTRVVFQSQTLRPSEPSEDGFVATEPGFIRVAKQLLEVYHAPCAAASSRRPGAVFQAMVFTWPRPLVQHLRVE